MKTTVVFLLGLAIAVQALTEEQIEKARRYSKECQEESGIDAETIAKVRRGEVVDDPKIKDQTFCFMKKIGFVNKDGEIQYDVIKEKTAELGTGVELQESVDTCKKAEKGDSLKDDAFEFFGCYMKHAQFKAGY